MIITNAVVLHITTSVVMLGSNSDQAEKFTMAYIIVEKIQVTIFSIQEFIISLLYILETRKILPPSSQIHRRSVRRVLRHLVLINVFIIALDMIVIGTEYANLYEIPITLKAAVYGIKLRFEFTILNQLMGILRSKNSSRSTTDPSHTFGRTDESGELALDSMHGCRRIRRKTYSVYASKGRGQDTDTAVASNVIQKSTNITVQTENAMNEFADDITEATEQSSSNDGVAIPPTAHAKGADGESISSAEIELTRMDT